MQIDRVSWSIREWPATQQKKEIALAEEDSLREVIVEITNRCQLNCQMGIRQAWEAKLGDMPLTFFSAILAQLRDLPTVTTLKFGGYGEPLLPPDFFAMVEAAHRQGLRTVATTNGLLLMEDGAEGLLDSGLDSLDVSVDGVSLEGYEEIRRGGAWAGGQSHLEGLQRLKERRGPEAGLAFGATRRNVAEMAHLQTLAQRVGASEILITNLLPHTAEMKKKRSFMELGFLNPFPVCGHCLWARENLQCP